MSKHRSSHETSWKLLKTTSFTIARVHDLKLEAHKPSALANDTRLTWLTFSTAKHNACLLSATANV